MMTSQPQFFIIRPGVPMDTADAHHAHHGSSIVPLIPIDLLPEWIDVQGVPRKLTLEETAGMTNLGSFAQVKERLKLRFLNIYSEEKLEEKHCSPTGSLSPTDNEHAKSGQASTPKSVNNGLQQSGEAAGCRSNGIDPVALRSSTQSPPCDLTPTSRTENTQYETANTNTDSTPTYPTISRGSISSVERNPPLAKRCQQWCHHGYCPRAGSCSFRHEMPQTAEGLAAIGLASWPPWWRRKRFDQPDSGSASSKESLKTRNPSKGWKLRKERKKGSLTDGQLTLKSTEKRKSPSGLHETSDAGLVEAANGTGETSCRIESEEPQVELLIDM